MKTTSLHNQSTSQTSSDNEPTRTLPDPGATQRIAWIPPNTASRLLVTPGGGPQPDTRAWRDLLRGVASLLLLLFLLWRMPVSQSHATAPALPPTSARPTQQPVPALIFEPLRPALSRKVSGSIRVYLVAPSVPIGE